MPRRRVTLVALAGVMALALGPPGLATAGGGGSEAYRAALHLSRTIGVRPSSSPAELRAIRYVAARFRAAGLRASIIGFDVPGRGRSHDVIGVYDTPHSCLRIAMAHIDSSPAGRGANDNASGTGVVTALADGMQVVKPTCDVWLAANGAEERFYTRHPDHLGSQALVRRVRKLGRARDLRLALDLDEVGITRNFWLRSREPEARPDVEGAIVKAARAVGVTVRWVRDSGSGNSDHREFERAGLPAAVLEGWGAEDPCRELACDRPGRLDRIALARAQRTAEGVLRRRP
ncbi:MAG: aminopeptidase YwaD [Thermoleophilaceae bacterium]|nr:aminopeptidase YwaD [Thermoleophilaceae bacterium]